MPRAIVGYAALATLDLGFTLVALGIGVREANPFLAWCQQVGLFEVAKIATTLFVISIAFFLWRLPIARWTINIGNVLMGGVAAFHLMFGIEAIQRLGR